jgi:hypothetical protein
MPSHRERALMAEAVLAERTQGRHVGRGAACRAPTSEALIGQTNPSRPMADGRMEFRPNEPKDAMSVGARHASPLREKRGHLDQTNPTEEPIISMSVPVRAEAGR